MISRTAADWETFLQANHVAAARVRKLAEAARDPHLAARGYFQPVRVPGIEGEMHLPLTPFRMQDGGARIDRPPARMGEHTDEVLREIGFDTAAIEGFRKAGAFGAKS
jgi:crotonobetainyl-CoA:carnitine CoA-transferase CaiB-like acyl-CoA transferase